MKKRICALLLAAVLVYMPYALAAAILTPLNHPADVYKRQVRHEGNLPPTAKRAQVVIHRAAAY